ncbi:hypothetical protein GCM10008908_09280 [Clostridium subterminale]|uniref:Uncharacterized protein n=1 Tax=Clostridium subterminale TaxID=1550 RepID=A0ABP3VX72_CLOSU
MEYIRIEYKDRVKEIKEFKTKEEMGMWIADILIDTKEIRYEDMSKKIRINTKDGKEIVRKLYDDKASILENIATMIDDIKLEEDRISVITIIEPRVGVFK